VTSCLPDFRILTVGSSDELASALQHLGESPVLLVDTDCFPLPEHPRDVTVICLGSAGAAGYPLLEKPLRAGELSALLQMRIPEPPAPYRDTASALHSVAARFQRDAVHDIKNQLTTVQGNLLLLTEEIENQVLQDMTDASERALELVDWLGQLVKDEPGNSSTDLVQLLNLLTPFFHRICERKTTFTLHSGSPPIETTAYPGTLLRLLLHLMDQLPGPPDTCQLEVVPHPDAAIIRCRWAPEAPLIQEEHLDIMASTCGVRLEVLSSAWIISCPN
jgi:signal transduction histidine kinase